MSDHNSNKPVTFQEKLEKNIWALVLATALVVSVGGIVEIVPLFYLKTTFEDQVHPEYEELKTVRPYTALELARVGGKYSDAWHIQHLHNPRSVVPESVMPSYPWLEHATIDGNGIEKRLRAMKVLGVPYTDEQINNAAAEVEGKTEMQALVAYLQVLGTMVNFEPGRSYRE